MLEPESRVPARFTSTAISKDAGDRTGPPRPSGELNQIDAVRSRGSTARVASETGFTNSRTPRQVTIDPFV